MGKSGIEVSAIGMGCWAIGGPWAFSNGEESWEAGWGQIDENESIRAIHAGLNLGVNFFDTAANYGVGHSEMILAKALDSRREKVVIATKFGFLVDSEKKSVQVDDDQIIANIRLDCEASLQRLGTEYIDIYQFHQGSYDQEKAPLVMEVLEELVKEGKIRWYDWSTDHTGRVRVYTAGNHCTSIQFDLNVYHDNPEIRSICNEFDLAGINKSPLNCGLLTGKFGAESTFPEDDIRHGWDFRGEDGAERLSQVEAVGQVFTANGHVLAQASLAYIWALR